MNMDHFPKISIVTPNYNLGDYLERTIESVLSQNYPNLEYIIIDGGSTDHSVEIIKKYESRLSYWVSEKDQGLYDALQKGLQKSTGEVMGWINSDDMLHAGSLYVLADIFTHNKDVEWIQGHPTVFDNQDRIVHQRAARSNKYKFYLGDYMDGNFIQQESTFWKRSLWNKAGEYVSTRYKLAGDFELWMRFFRYADLYNTPALIGGFRIRGQEQLSRADLKKYYRQAEEITAKELTEISEEIRENLRMIQKYRKGIKSNLLIRKYQHIFKAKKIHELLKEHSIAFDFVKNTFTQKTL